jgi:hypothetical protein
VSGGNHRLRFLTSGKAYWRVIHVGLGYVQQYHEEEVGQSRRQLHKQWRAVLSRSFTDFTAFNHGRPRFLDGSSSGYPLALFLRHRIPQTQEAILLQWLRSFLVENPGRWRLHLQRHRPQQRHASGRRHPRRCWHEHRPPSFVGEPYGSLRWRLLRDVRSGLHARSGQALLGQRLQDLSRLP